MASEQINSASAASRYGAALFDLANDDKCLPAVELELLSVRNLVSESAVLRETISSPVIAASEKTAVLIALAKKAKWSKLTTNFIAVACDNGRAAELTEMVDAFLAKVAQAKGLLTARAKTATILTAKQKTDLASGLKKALGRNVKLETEVDSRLLGGLIVSVGSVMFDSSLKTQLEGLKLAMKES